MRTSFYRAKGGLLKALPSAAAMAAVALASGHVAADPMAGDTVTSDLYGQGVVCSSPTVARDLIGVRDQPSVYRAWLHGYLESGHCAVWNPRQSGLAPTAKSARPQDAVRQPRLWAVYAPMHESQGGDLNVVVVPPIR